MLFDIKLLIGELFYCYANAQVTLGRSLVQICVNLCWPVTHFLWLSLIDLEKCLPLPHVELLLALLPGSLECPVKKIETGLNGLS